MNQPYLLWIGTAIDHTRFWLRKMGLDAQARRTFWLSLAERELREGDGDAWLVRPVRAGGSG